MIFHWLLKLQDDFLDCFGDPVTIGKIGTDIQDNKCSWLINQALARASPEQMAVLEVSKLTFNWNNILKENYGRNDPAKVDKVKQIYKELDLEKVYRDYEQSSFAEIQHMIDDVTAVPQAIFRDFAKRIFKRQK